MTQLKLFMVEAQNSGNQGVCFMAK